MKHTLKWDQLSTHRRRCNEWIDASILRRYFTAAIAKKGRLVRISVRHSSCS
jgi:hypothetical protein